jgi:hypothetical protein
MTRSDSIYFTCKDEIDRQIACHLKIDHCRKVMNVCIAYTPKRKQNCVALNRLATHIHLQMIGSRVLIIINFAVFRFFYLNIIRCLQGFYLYV